MSRTAATAVIVTSILLIAGCGGDGADPQAVKAQDAQARTDARNLVSEVELCYAENQDYSRCRKPPATKLPLGSGKGQVEVTKATTGGYTIVAHSKSGNSFTISRSGTGPLKRTCDAAGSKEGGCKGGTW